MARTFAYCRVSTANDTADSQLQEIFTAAGFDVQPHQVVTETLSGSVSASDRPGFTRLLDRLEAGDVLVVTKLNRLGCNAIDVRATVEALAKRRVHVHCLSLGGMDLTAPAAKAAMDVIGAVAELERDVLIDQEMAGLPTQVQLGESLRPEVYIRMLEKEIQTATRWFGAVAECRYFAQVLTYIRATPARPQARRQAAAFGMALSAFKAVGISTYFEDTRHVLDEVSRAKAAVDSAAWHARGVVTTTSRILEKAQEFVEATTINCTEWAVPGEVALVVLDQAKEQSALDLGLD
jgi:putative DNA-invertase from lambdoid prophage Rac